MLRKIRNIILFFILIIGIALFAVFSYYWFNWYKNSYIYIRQTETYFNNLNHFVSSDNTNHFNYDQSFYPIQILDRNKHLISIIKTNNKIITSYSHLGKNFISALISSEDKSFFSHHGINFAGIFRALIKDIMYMRFAEGGSTITQQLSKLLFSNQERTIKRKMNEIFTSLTIEKFYTKEDILFMYSNLIYFGHNIYGVGLAAHSYFGKDISQLSIPEAALLVSVISNPVFYDPYKRPYNTKKKHLAVLLNMAQEHYISKKDAILYFNHFWKNPTLLPVLSKKKEHYIQNKAPYVTEQVKRFLRQHYGSHYISKLRGSKIYTTIDLDLQNYGLKYTQNYLKQVQKQSKIKSSEKSSIQSSYVISEPKTGHILSFIGGSGFNSKNQFNRAFQAKRQTGSTLKPFLYTVGLNLGLITPYTVFRDVPIEIKFKDGYIWDVHNYANTYRGYLNVIDALKRSSNVVAVEAIDKIGLHNLKLFFKKALSLTERQAENLFADNQYSIVLGSLEMTPLKINQLYQILANKGIMKPLYFIEKIKNIKGNIVYEHQNKTIPIISKESVFLMKSILKQVMENGGSGNYVQRHFNFDIDIAGKSGTSQHNKDVLFAGFSTSLVINTWIGHDKGYPLGEKFLGGIQAGNIFGSLMQYALKKYPGRLFTTRENFNFIKSDVDLLTGDLPSEDSLFAVKGLFIKGTEPKETTTLTIKDQLDIALEKKIITPQKYQQLINKYNLNPYTNIINDDSTDIEE